ncbi:hypothetical protein OJF2_10150 [Aquisphaera giovannonii]|uniref:Uncharacterized protein n=1 Tax=Aquisphaera giovannonii TaxID=406548 RepID=A0A5B9VWB8_9BACT|nr:hypothetical protein [Aquisphaera giovannonii]QEH32538.1 hypothetical protein OJF2_10150 [Aquisphaera giovannonii]
MNDDRPPVLVPATPEYVLEVIRDSHRQQCRFDPEADPTMALTFETTVDAWRSACDLIGWRRLGRALDDEWRLGLSDTAWKAVLEPARERTLRDVCGLIAARGSRPVIRPLTILGRACRPAGAFLAIRSLLRDAGADVDGLSPSTPLREYTRHHPRVFLGPISRLAPNALPPVEVRTPLHEISSCGPFLVGFLLWIAGIFLGPGWSLAGVLVMLAGWAVSWLTAALPSERVEFGDLRTFRDLSHCLAENSHRP